jgi:hypothetical protein
MARGSIVWRCNESQQIGHASVQTTPDRYSRLLQDSHPAQAAETVRKRRPESDHLEPLFFPVGSC